MTADGTYRSSRVGDTVDLPATMAEVPFAWVLIDGDGIAWQVREDDDGLHIQSTLHKHEHHRYEASSWATWIEDFTPITVLFRPDAPQPAVTADAVERAARALMSEWECEPLVTYPPEGAAICEQHDMSAWADGLCGFAVDAARAALAAARAGEAEYTGPTYEQVWQAITGRDEPWGGCADREAVERVMALILPGVAQHTGEAETEHAEVAAERVRQVAKGYDATHDDRHGAFALARFAEGYVSRGITQGNRSDFIKAAAMLEAAAASFRRLGHPLGTEPGVAAQRGGEAVDREALLSEVAESIGLKALVEFARADERYCCQVGCGHGGCETCPCCVAGWCVMGADGLPGAAEASAEDFARWLAVAAEHNPVAAALLAARGDAAATVTADLAALHQSEESTIQVPVFDEFDSPYQVVTRCRECQRPWPCKTAAALGIEVRS